MCEVVGQAFQPCERYWRSRHVENQLILASVNGDVHQWGLAEGRGHRLEAHDRRMQVPRNLRGGIIDEGMNLEMVGGQPDDRLSVLHRGAVRGRDVVEQHRHKEAHDDADDGGQDRVGQRHFDDERDRSA